MKIYKAATSSFISFRFKLAFISGDIIFHKFPDLHPKSEKDFCDKFSFFNRFTQHTQTTPSTAISEKLSFSVSVCFLKSPSI